MTERSLVDRVLGMWEEGWHYSALKTLTETLTEEVEAQGRRLAELEAEYPLPRQQTEQHTIIPPSQGGS